MSRGSCVVLSLAMSTVVLAGCIGDGNDDLRSSGAGDLVGEAFDTSRGWSVPLTPARFEMSEPVKLALPSFDATEIAIGLFLPTIPGCDWEATELPAACNLPTVMDAGPYYADHVDRDKYRPPIIEWLVPRGYAVVQMSVRGTGESAGCMEFMSMNEQKDVDALITWIAEQPWSNGNVGMMGRSYDGTTPLMAAALANPALKTIVPISSVTSVADLMFKNGTAEVRGPIMHSVVYWGFYGVGIDDGGELGHRAEHLPEQLCEEFVVGTEQGALTTVTGSAGDRYWQDRDFRERILDDYRGSIWIVHGLEDWNVNPSMVVPWTRELADAGIETRAWLGVWGHAYPDRVDEHRNVRWDWAQQTLDWFEYYLRGAGAAPRLGVEVEDSLYTWRYEETYPPRDAAWLDQDVPWSGSVVTPTLPVLHHEFEPLVDDLRIAGLPRLEIEVTPVTATGGYLFAELYDRFPDGRSVRIGWAAMNLRYYNGGNLEPEVLVPGMPIVARMEFEPVDAHIGAGHNLQLLVHRGRATFDPDPNAENVGMEDILPSPDVSPLVVGAATLRLPTIVRDDPAFAPSGLGGSERGLLPAQVAAFGGK